MLTKDDLGAIQTIISNEVKPIKKDVASLKKDVRKLRKDLNITITSFDREIIDTRRRVNRIEDHLHLPPLQAN